MKISMRQLIGIAIPAIILAAFFASYDEIGKPPDAGNYIRLADEIASGEFFEKIDVDKVHWARAIRSPGYPLIIMVATGGNTDNINYMLVMHALVALFSLIFLSITLRHYCPPVVTGFVIAFVQIMMRDWFSVVMTEFVAFNILLIIFGLIVTCIRNPSFRNLFLLGLLASLAPLVRPALLPVIVLMPLMLIYRRKCTIGEGSLLASTVVPLIIWMSFNLYTIGAFTLTQVHGLNMLGIGSQVGYATEEPGDSEGLKAFIKMMNEAKTPAMGEEDDYIDNLDETYKFRLLSNSLWIPASLISKRLGDKVHPARKAMGPAGPVTLHRDYYAPYGERAIMANPGNYVKYIIYGLTLFFSFAFPYALFVFLLVPLTGIYRKKNLVLSYAALAMFSIHLAEGVLVSAYEAVWDRYIVLSFYPYFAAILICFFGLLYAEGIHRRLEALTGLSLPSVNDK